MEGNYKGLVLYNALCYIDKAFTNRTLILSDGRIEGIIDDFDRHSLKEGYQLIDCTDYIITPGFIDSHLHLPGDYLYQLYGLDFSKKYSYQEYMDIIKEAYYKENTILRGFGWNNDIMKSKGMEGFIEIKSLLDNLFADRCFIMFSDDYHSCICNEQIIKKYNPVKKYDYSLQDVGLLEEEDVFELLEQLPELAFTNEEIRDAILKYQDMLIRNGITGIQSLMFLGGNNDIEWKVLKELDDNKQLFVNVNLAITINPDDTMESLMKRYHELVKLTSDRIKVNTVKVYIDGVVDNKTAYISKPYEHSSSNGYSLWKEEQLYDLCLFADQNDLQIHAHAIGDLAVHIITKTLCKVMDTNRSIRKNRHVITHLQLADNDDIKLMGEYGIIANIQPFWIPVDGYYYPIDVKNIGDRVLEEYKVKSFLDRGVVVTSSSDSPVTQDIYPVIGMTNAIFRKDIKERVSLADILDTFTYNGAYQLKREHQTGLLKCDYQADLAVLSNTLNDASREKFENTQLLMTIVNGSIRYSKL